MMKMAIGLMFLASGFAQASETPQFSKRMDCSLQAPSTGIPAIPKYQFEVGRDESSHAYVLKLAALRPLGLPPAYQTLQRVGATDNAGLFKTAEVTAVVVNLKNSQSALLLTTAGLVYRCVSENAICASGNYDAENDRCVFDNSVIPLPNDGSGGTP